MSELVIYLATPASFLRRFLPLSALIIIICIIVYLPSPMTVISGREYTLGEVTVTAGIILLILACALYFRKRVTEIFLYNAEKKITVKYTTGFSKSAQLDIPFEKLTVESRDRPSKNISKDLVVERRNSRYRWWMTAWLSTISYQFINTLGMLPCSDQRVEFSSFGESSSLCRCFSYRQRFIRSR
jgi:hypothetical protein